MVYENLTNNSTSFMLGPPAEGKARDTTPYNPMNLPELINHGSLRDSFSILIRFLSLNLLKKGSLRKSRDNLSLKLIH